MKAAVENYGSSGEDGKNVLSQAARELLLLQSSDWPFLITTGQAKEYAIQRFQQHVERFNRLLDTLENGSPDEGLTKELWEKDKVFPDIDFNWFSG
jgi:1,4-alpha-glucan branching enzyme